MAQMTTVTDSEGNGCNFQWKIVNVSHWWWLMKGEGIESPDFVADALVKTKWSLWFHPFGVGNEDGIHFFLKRKEDCCGPKVIEVNFQLAFLRKDGSILSERMPLKFRYVKNSIGGYKNFEGKERVFVNEKDLFIPEDTLTLQCTIYSADKNPDRLHHMYATSVIKVKRRSFVWRFDKFGTLKSGKRYKFQDYLICFQVLIHDDFYRLCMDVTSFDGAIKYISCTTSVVDSGGRKENCAITKYFAGDLKQGTLSSTLLLPELLDEDESRYLKNDILTLVFELVISTLEHSDCRKYSMELENEVTGKEARQYTTDLIYDFKALYTDAIFSDIELRTSTKTFPAHKAILSARSPVFKNMFSNDMKEKNSCYVEITDFDDDTIHRMLLYLYSDSLDDMHWKVACKLYMIADKYQILPLKSECSSFLEEYVSTTNPCEVLSLSVLYHDHDLQTSVEDYILGQSKQFFCSKEWKDFMNSHIEIAADIMLRKISKSRMHSK